MQKNKNLFLKYFYFYSLIVTLLQYIMEPSRHHFPRNEYILMTYRSGIAKAFESTYYTSDSGWGCMLRVGQMLMANLLYQQGKAKVLQIISLFYDNMDLPFSIQTITHTALQLYPQKKPYEWFTPCQIGFIVKKLIDNYDSYCRVSICNDNTLFLSDIVTDRKKLLVLVMCRIGLDQPQEAYLKCIIKMFYMKYFFAIMGGTPKKAHLFLQHKDNKFGYLDPHQTLQVPETIYELKNYQKQYIGKLQWVDQKKIDTSMCLCFCMMKEELQDFWSKMQQMKKQLKQGFFLYMQRQRPELGEQQIFEIIDDD